MSVSRRSSGRARRDARTHDDIHRTGRRTGRAEGTPQMPTTPDAGLSHVHGHGGRRARCAAACARAEPGSGSPWSPTRRCGAGRPRPGPSPGAYDEQGPVFIHADECPGPETARLPLPRPGALRTSAATPPTATSWADASGDPGSAARATTRPSQRPSPTRRWRWYTSGPSSTAVSSTRCAAPDRRTPAGRGAGEWYGTEWESRFGSSRPSMTRVEGKYSDGGNGNTCFRRHRRGAGAHRGTGRLLRRRGQGGITVEEGQGETGRPSPRWCGRPIAQRPRRTRRG